MLKKFSDFLRTREQDETGQGAIDVPAPATPEDMGQDKAGGDDALLGALKVALTKFRPQVEKFVNHLAAQDEEIKAALSGSEAPAPSPDGDSDDVIPSAADAPA